MGLYSSGSLYLAHLTVNIVEFSPSADRRESGFQTCLSVLLLVLKRGLI